MKLFLFSKLNKFGLYQCGTKKHRGDYDKGLGMYAVCLLFSGRRGLNSQHVRNSILRIPEVSRKIKQAQVILDSTLTSNESIDLFAYLQATNEEFEANQNLKSLTVACVQVGLYDRYVRYRNRPQFLIGRTNGSSAMLVCAEKQSFNDLIVESDFVQERLSFRHLHNMENTETQLKGLRLEEYGAYQWSQEALYNEKTFDSKDMIKILSELSNENLVDQCINVGPQCEQQQNEFEERGLNNLSSMSSIDLDPILSSFWKSA